jgi:hypothetical protein
MNTFESLKSLLSSSLLCSARLRPEALPEGSLTAAGRAEKTL